MVADPGSKPAVTLLDFTLDDLVGEVLKVMSDGEMLDRYDAYGGAMFALDLREVLKQVYEKRGLKFKPEEDLGT